MSNSSPPIVDYTQEVRFAVVMYGGVSLAIYINGIAQEMLRWVRSTAKDAKSNVALLPSNLTSGAAGAPQPPALSGTERVYRKLSYILANNGGATDADTKMARAEAQLLSDEPINTRFVVDILSGTSAGGINGVFLAKALANGQNISDLEDLWITEGDISTLINDRKSVETPLKLQDPPASLLNGQRMYLELLKAFDGMEKSNSGAYVDELDLFVTTTDLSGVTLPIRLADGVVYERRHRNVLRFIYSKKEVSFAPTDRNDFEAKYNPFLAYAARCTSAFPFAFEPMSLCDADYILERYGSYPKTKSCRSDSSEWQRFYKDYLNPVGVRTVEFPKRAFADGGYLDNKPFTYATETLARRQAHLPVTRKLIYIEPSPEHPEDVEEKEGKPDAIQNVSAALLSLPRYETIREDLQRLRDHNRLVERVNRILSAVDKAFKDTNKKRNPQLDDEGWGNLDLAGLLDEKGPGYLAYHNFEVGSVTDDLASLVTRVAGFDEESDFFLIIRSLVRAWRKAEYEKGKRSNAYIKFLSDFNLAYPMRRINFLRTKIAEVSRQQGNQSTPEQQEQLRTIKAKLNDAYKDLRSTARHLRSREVPKKKDETGELADPSKRGERLEPAHLTEGVDIEAKRKESEASDGLPVCPAYDEIDQLKKAIANKTYESLPADVRMKLKDPSEGLQPEAVGEEAKREETIRARAVLEVFLGHGGDYLDGNESGNIESEGQDSSTRRNIESKTDQRAVNFLESSPEILALFQSMATALMEPIKAVKIRTDKMSRAVLGLSDESSDETEFLPEPTKDPRAYLGYYYQYYDDYDMVVFPLMYGTEIGEAAKVDIIRISPEDAKALIDERGTGCYKLAGNALGHFGAFLDPLWRKNDIMWGRLDGAERIITALLPDEPELARMLTGEAQAAIVQEAIEPLGVTEASTLLCESAMRPKSPNADCKLLEQFVDNLTTHRTASQLTRLVDGKATEMIDGKALRQHYLDTFPTRSKLDPESTLKTTARATTVVGKMLSALSDRHNVNSNSVAWIARFGSIFSSLVEVSVPRSLPNLLFRHWLKLLYLFEVFLICGATLLTEPGVAQLGWTLLGITACVNIGSWWLSDVMLRKRTIFRLLIQVLGAGLLILALIGALKVSGVFFGLTIDGLPPLNWMTHHLQQLSGWLESKLPKAIWAFVKGFVPLLAALLGILALWKLGGRRTQKAR